MKYEVVIIIELATTSKEDQSDKVVQLLNTEMPGIEIKSVAPVNPAR